MYCVGCMFAISNVKGEELVGRGCGDLQGKVTLKVGLFFWMEMECLIASAIDVDMSWRYVTVRTFCFLYKYANRQETSALRSCPDFGALLISLYTLELHLEVVHRCLGGTFYQIWACARLFRCRDDLVAITSTFF